MTDLSKADFFGEGRTTSPYWNESVWFSVSIPERHIHGMIQYYFRPNMGMLNGGPVLWDPSGQFQWNCLYYNWSHLQAVTPGAEKFNMTSRNSLNVEMLEPLKRYKIGYDKEGFAMDLVWEAVGPCHELVTGDPGQKATAGFHIEQPGRMRGTIRRHGERFAVDCFSMRDTSYGAREYESLASGGYFWGIAQSSSFHALCMTSGDGLGREANCIGGYLYKLNQFEQALGYFQRSVKLKEELNDKRGIINGWLGLGDVYKEQNKYMLSEKYYLKALQSAQEMKLILEEARCNNQLGLLYRRMGDAANAIAHFQRALDLAKQAGDNTMAASSNSELMALAVQAKQEKKLESELFSNLNTFINMGDRSGEALEYFRLSEYYALNNQYDKALHYLKKHHQLKDSLEGSSVLIQIKQLEEQYENDKKEKEIALLKKDQELQSLALRQQRTNNSLIIVALISVVVISVLLLNRYRVVNRNRRLLEVEKMRNNIARDLHDDIGSTLSSINIISQLALKENEKAPQHLQRIAENSARIMENMSDIVWSIHPNNDKLEQVLMKMKEFTAEILESRNIAYEFKVEEGIGDLKLEVGTRKNVFLIVKEAINNAAKYSEAHEVIVNLKVTPGRFHVAVTDNGKGFDTSLNKTGNGLRNMKERAESIKGTFLVNSMLGKGTEISLDVPIT